MWISIINAFKWLYTAISAYEFFKKVESFFKKDTQQGDSNEVK